MRRRAVSRDRYRLSSSHHRLTSLTAEELELVANAGVPTAALGFAERFVAESAPSRGCRSGSEARFGRRRATSRPSARPAARCATPRTCGGCSALPSGWATPSTETPFAARPRASAQTPSRGWRSCAQTRRRRRRCWPWRCSTAPPPARRGGRPSSGWRSSSAASRRRRASRCRRFVNEC